MWLDITGNGLAFFFASPLRVTEGGGNRCRSSRQSGGAPMFGPAHLWTTRPTSGFETWMKCERPGSGGEEGGSKMESYQPADLACYAGDGELTHHPVGSQGSLNIARQHVGGVMSVVRDTGQPSVDGQQNQEKL